MKRHVDRATEDPLGILGKTWKVIGRDGGAETCAWRLVYQPEEEARPDQGRVLWPDHPQSADRARPSSRTWTDRLFKDGLLAPIFLVGLYLLGPIAWLLGFR